MAETNTQAQPPSATDAAQKAAQQKADADKKTAEANAGNQKDVAAQEAARKKVADLKQQLADAQKEAEATGVLAETSPDDDKKRAEQGAGPAAFVISGRAGGPFNIDGQNLGTAGTLVIGNRYIEIGRWNDRSIKGQLPMDLAPGEVIIRPAGGGEFKGTWPPPAAQPVVGFGGQTVLGQPVPQQPTK